MSLATSGDELSCGCYFDAISQVAPQKQATPEEAEILLKTGLWPWPDELKNEYVEKIWSSPIIKIEPQYALNYAMGIYNKNAAIQLLAWNTKEGEFLLYGGDLGLTNIDNIEHNTIKCYTEDNGTSVMKKKIYTLSNFCDFSQKPNFMQKKTKNQLFNMPIFMNYGI